MSERRAHLQAAVRDELERRDAGAVVHAGTRRDPSLLYCLAAVGDGSAVRPDPETARAVAIDGETALACGLEGSTHPAESLANRLAARGIDGPLLAPPHVPHDAALHLEESGFALASTTVVERARAGKTDVERERIERAQAAASAGVRRAAGTLSDASVVDGRLEFDGDALSAERLRRRVDAAIVEGGAFPAGNTAVATGNRSTETPLRPSEPIVVAAAPRGPDGYHGGLARTFLVDGRDGVGDDGGTGGWERRARVALTRAFESARVLLSGDGETVRSVEADLEAEVGAFGFADDVRTSVSGVGLEAVERPRDPGTEIGREGVVRIDAAVVGDDGAAVRFADLLVGAGEEPRWLEAPERTFEPGSVAP